MGQFKSAGSNDLEQCFRRDTEVITDSEETKFMRLVA